jgi:hypothetical protein
MSPSSPIKKRTVPSSSGMESAAVKTAHRLIESLGDGDTAAFGDSFLGEEGIITVVEALRHNKSEWLSAASLHWPCNTSILIASPNSIVN